ncbi:MAG: glycosyltransferase [Rhodothermales bacterium]|nr:glycosyltransferase [Rhodothermales bacterium]
MTAARPHIVLFDLYAGGHHGQYLRQLIEHWGAQQRPGRLEVVVPPSFAGPHPDVPEAAARFAGAGVSYSPLPEPVALPYDGPLGLVRTDRAHGRLLRETVRRLEPDHVVLMYADHVLLSLGLGLRLPGVATLSGIYFRPSFHYRAFDGDDAGPKERLKRIEKRTRLRLALRNPHLTHLFCLDPYVVPYAERMAGGVAAVPLPDGITLHPPGRTPEATRTRWGVEPGRRVALLFGVVDERKGVYPVIEALGRLPETAQRQVALVLAGPVPEAERARQRAAIERLRATSAVQVVQDTRFIPDEEIQDLMRAADLALVTYQRHVGSSNVLVRAADAAVPVLGSSYGLVGEHLRRRRLGLPADATDPRALADGFGRWLAGTLPFDADAARRFAAEHTADAYAATILDAVGGG